MGQVSASSTVLIDAEPEAVLAAVADYETVRPKILSSHYREYQVLEGGQGAGTVATWKLQATEVARARRQGRRRRRRAHGDREGRQLVDGHQLDRRARRDRAPSVTVKTSWQGAGGVKGFFEKTFAPLGLRRIQAEVLANLKKRGRERLGRALRRTALRRPGGQEAGDAADDGVGVLLPAVGAFISAESAGFFMLPISTRIDGYCARFSPVRSERGYSPLWPM